MSCKGSWKIHCLGMLESIKDKSTVGSDSLDWQLFSGFKLVWLSSFRYKEDFNKWLELSQMFGVCSFVHCKRSEHGKIHNNKILQWFHSVHKTLEVFVTCHKYNLMMHYNACMLVSIFQNIICNRKIQITFQVTLLFMATELQNRFSVL